MRTQFGAHFWWVSLFSVFIGQTLFLFAACTSMYGALQSPLPLSSADALAAATAASGILLEAVADVQMDWFQQARREKRAASLVLSSGLWAWSCVLCRRRPLLLLSAPVRDCP